MTSISSKDEETNKRLDSAILAGAQILVLDNIEAPLGGDKLCSLLSEPKITIRPLGGSGIVELPTAMTVLVTGNNLRLKGDVTRRAVTARLDSRQERPERRTFDQDVVAEAARDRWNLIRAALTIVLAYRAAGCPNVVEPIGSFECWDRNVRSPLIWAGCGDPVATIERQREDDPVLGDLKAMMTIWSDTFGAEKKTVADVLRVATPPDCPLFDVLEGIAGERGLINRRKLGHYLRRHMDRVVGGLRIESAGESRGSAVWRVVPA